MKLQTCPVCGAEAKAWRSEKEGDTLDYNQKIVEQDSDNYRFECEGTTTINENGSKDIQCPKTAEVVAEMREELDGFMRVTRKELNLPA